MERRQFLTRCAGVGGALLGRDAVEFSRQNLGVASDYATSGKPRLPVATRATGRVVGAEGATAVVSVTGRGGGPVSVRVVRRTYPTGEPLSTGVSDRALEPAAGASETVRVVVPRNGRTASAWFYEVRVEPEADADSSAYLCESRPYRWTTASGGGPPPADRVVAAPGPATEDRFERRLDGNEYALSYRWRDARGAEWSVAYRVRRSTHEAAVAGERGYVRTYEESLASPVVHGLVDALADARRTSPPAQAGADASEPPVLGDLDAGRRFAGLVRFVQHVDYARDAATLDTYDYNRTVPETLVAGVGDCKDLTHLLAGLLSTAFDCETALLFQPGHLLLGVAAGDVPALPSEPPSVVLGGRELVPIDTSLDAPVGHATDDPFVAAYGDGEWFHHDPAALAGSVDDVVRDWLDLATPFAWFS